MTRASSPSIITRGFGAKHVVGALVVGVIAGVGVGWYAHWRYAFQRLPTPVNDQVSTSLSSSTPSPSTDAQHAQAPAPSSSLPQNMIA